MSGSGTVNLPVGGRPALSTYEVSERYGNEAALLRVSTTTGRKHQVREHCAVGLGRPIFLDPKFYTRGENDGVVVSRKGKKMGEDLPSEDGSAAIPESVRTAAKEWDENRFFLHASSLSIPEFGVKVEAPLPRWWEEAIEGL